MRTFFGIPVTTWAIGIVAGVVGFVWMRKRTQGQGTGTTGTGQPTFTQQQEVQDFQIFSALTAQQQASDLNFLGTVMSLFGGGGSPTSSAGTSTTTTTPAPANTGGMPPAVSKAYENEVQSGLQFGSQPMSSQLQQIAASSPQNQAALSQLNQAITATPADQRGSLENFFLLNEANQSAGYDYYTPQGTLQTTSLGVAPGE